jgi:hypothetical protein
MNAPANAPHVSAAHAQATHSDTAAEAPQALMQLMMGAWVSQITGTLARLRVFDEIAKGHNSAAAIARQLSVNPSALNRALRAASMIGLLRAAGQNTFELTPQGELLRSDVPGSMRALLDAETAPGHWLPWGRLDECIRTGGSVASETLGFPNIWDYYEANAVEGKAFSQGMSGISRMAIGAISATWKPPAAHRVVDVGGAHGAFLSWVLEQLPEAKGQIVDLPHVIETARPAIAAAGLSNRVECLAGDFFKSVPAGGDLYLLKHIVHDWDDASVSTILNNVSQAMAPNATVAVVELLIPEDGTPSPALLMDINMLVMLPGKERTVGEMKQLFASAGLALTRVVPTHSPFSLLEARKA